MYAGVSKGALCAPRDRDSGWDVARLGRGREVAGPRPSG